jgi:AcrR family transcriptional regulator
MSVQPLPARATNAGGRETQELLIRTAERLFAEHGIDAVSLRQIISAAGMRMASAVAYHFGDKAGLIRAIIDDRSIRIDERARALLADLDHNRRLGDLRAVTTAITQAAVEGLGDTGHYFRFLAQVDRHPQLISELQATQAFRAASRRIIDLQDAAASRQLPTKLIPYRRRLVTHVVLAALADLEADAERGVDEVAVADLIDCVVALYSTPASERTLDALRTRRRRTRKK